MPEQVVMMLDVSWSMVGVLKQTKQKVIQISKSINSKPENIDFFTFSDNLMHHPDQKSFENQPVLMSTKIENNLVDIFTSHLKGNRNNTCNFYLITDAEDTIKDKDNVKKLLHSCATKYKDFNAVCLYVQPKNLSCLPDLEDIFAKNNVISIENDENFNKYIENFTKIDCQMNQLKEKVIQIKDSTDDSDLKEAAENAEAAIIESERINREAQELAKENEELEEKMQPLNDRNVELTRNVNNLANINDENKQEELAEKYEKEIEKLNDEWCALYTEAKRNNTKAKFLFKQLDNIRSNCKNMTDTVQNKSGEKAQELSHIILTIQKALDEIKNLQLSDNLKVLELSKNVAIKKKYYEALDCMKNYFQKHQTNEERILKIVKTLQDDVKGNYKKIKKATDDTEEYFISINKKIKELTALINILCEYV